MRMHRLYRGGAGGPRRLGRGSGLHHRRLLAGLPGFAGCRGRSPDLRADRSMVIVGASRGVCAVGRGYIPVGFWPGCRDSRGVGGVAPTYGADRSTVIVGGDPGCLRRGAGLHPDTPRTNPPRLLGTIRGTCAVGRGYIPDGFWRGCRDSRGVGGVAPTYGGRSTAIFGVVPGLREGLADGLAVGLHGGFGAVEVEFDGAAAALAEDAGDGGLQGGAVVVEAAVGGGVGAVGRTGALAGGGGLHPVESSGLEKGG